jgi:hypothetical protein
MHQEGNWGNITPTEWEENESCVFNGYLSSAYEASNGRRFLINTQADRSVTTVLLPSEIR